MAQRTLRSERRGRREKLRQEIATDAQRRGEERREILRPRSRAQDDGFDARAERRLLQVNYARLKNRRPRSFDPARRDLRMNRAAAQFTNSTAKSKARARSRRDAGATRCRYAGATDSGHGMPCPYVSRECDARRDLALVVAAG